MIGKRIKALRKACGLSQGALALRLGLTQQAVGKWETGQSVPDYHMLVRLSEALGIEPDSLFDRRDSADTVNTVNTGKMNMGKMRTLPFFPGEQKMVPVLGLVRAGYGLPAEEDARGMEPAAVNDPSRHFYLMVQGDSMEPGIKDGDLALVRRQSALEDGDLGVVIYGDGEGTLKRFHRKGDTVALQAFNPAYETLILAGDELEKLYIVGKVVETKTRWS